MPFLSLNPEKLFWSQTGPGRRHYQLDSSQKKSYSSKGPRRGQRATELPQMPPPSAGPKTPSTEEPDSGLRIWQTWPRTTHHEPLAKPCNCWTGGTERLVQKKDWNVTPQTYGATTHWLESPKELQTLHPHHGQRPTLLIHVCEQG